MRCLSLSLGGVFRLLFNKAAMGNTFIYREQEARQHSTLLIILVTVPVILVLILSLLCCFLHSRDTARHEERKQRSARQRLARETDSVEREIQLMLHSRYNQAVMPRSLFIP